MPQLTSTRDRAQEAIEHRNATATSATSTGSSEWWLTPPSKQQIDWLWEQREAPLERG